MKLKKIFFAFLFIVLGITLGSCDNDFLNTLPQDKISPDKFWLTSTDAETALNALYIHLPSLSDPNGKESADPTRFTEIEWDMLSDIAHANDDATKLIRIERSEQTADLTVFLDLWRDLYRGVHDVNYFIENVSKVTENDPLFTDEIMKNEIAQARVIRAINYMKLVTIFGSVPLITKTLTLEEGRNVTQVEPNEIWDYVATEFDEAALDLKTSYKDESSSIGHITKGAAWGMKARAMLYAGRYAEAETAAQKVMDLNTYSLYPYYSKMFTYEGQNNCEVILDRQYEKAIAPYGLFNSMAPKGMNGKTSMVPTRTLIDAYETVDGSAIDPYNPYANRDPRLYATVYLPAFSDAVAGDIMYNGVELDPRPGSGTVDEINVDYRRTKTGFGIKKYINKEDLNDRSNCGTNFIILRYADVLLMYAEARIEQNKIDATVYNAINQVRNGRKDVKLPSIPAGKSQEQLRQIVRHEREVELALEGLRYFDLRRWHTAEDVLEGLIPGFRYVAIGDDSQSGKINEVNYGGVIRAFNAQRDYLFPIPQQELDLNTNLKQNTGY